MLLKMMKLTEIIFEFSINKKEFVDVFRKNFYFVDMNLNFTLSRIFSSNRKSYYGKMWNSSILIKPILIFLNISIIQFNGFIYFSSDKVRLEFKLELTKQFKIISIFLLVLFIILFLFTIEYYKYIFIAYIFTYMASLILIALYLTVKFKRDMKNYFCS